MESQFEAKMEVLAEELREKDRVSEERAMAEIESKYKHQMETLKEESALTQNEVISVGSQTPR